jgi:hypothetical protein
MVGFRPGFLTAGPPNGKALPGTYNHPGIDYHWHYRLLKSKPSPILFSKGSGLFDYIDPVQERPCNIQLRSRRKSIHGAG